MKLNTKLFGALSIALLMASCARIQEEEPEVTYVEQEVVIHATQEQKAGSKSVLNEDGSVYWQPRDEIFVFFGTIGCSFFAYNMENAASAYFVGTALIAAGHNENSPGIEGEYVYYGLYPIAPGAYYRDYREEDDYDGEEFYLSEPNEIGFDNPSRNGHNITTMLPSRQRGVAGTFDRTLNITLAKSEDYKELAFYNVCGGLRFKLSEDDIVKVTFQGNGEEPVAGVFDVTMDDSGLPKVAEVTRPRSEITVVLEDGEAFAKDTWYYIMMLPTTFEQGYTMTFYKENGKAVKVTGEAATVKRSVFASLENPDSGLEYEAIYHAESIKIEGGESESGESEWIVIGDTLALRAVVTPENCSFPVVWTSSDPEVATVDEEGNVVALTEGETLITATVEDMKAEKWVTVDSGRKIREFYLTYEEERVWNTEVYVGSQIQLAAVFVPASAAVPVEWSSDNEEVASVDENGLVTVHREGYADITAKAGEEWEATCRIDAHFRDGEFTITAADISGAYALALMPYSDDDEDERLCLYKIDDDGHATPVPFTFTSDDSVIEAGLNGTGFVSATPYWLTDRYIFLNDVTVYDNSSLFSQDGRRYGDDDPQIGGMVIRVSDGKILLVENNDPGKEFTSRFYEKLPGHWKYQMANGIFRWSYDGRYLYSWGGNSHHPWFRMYDRGDALVVEDAGIDLSESQFGLGERKVLLDKNSNLANLHDDDGYVFFGDGGMAEIPIPDGVSSWDGGILERNYNWYLFTTRNYGTEVYQIEVEGHTVKETLKASLYGSEFDYAAPSGIKIDTDDAILFFNSSNQYVLKYTLSTNTLTQTSFPASFVLDWQYSSWGRIITLVYGGGEAVLDGLGHGYSLNGNILTEYDLVDLTVKEIPTDRSAVPAMTPTTPYYDSANNCFFESGTRHSDTKTITVVTDCATGEVTVYEGGYDQRNFAYLKLK